MKRFLVVATVLAVLAGLALGATAALAAKGDNPANDNPNNLYLYQKGASWDIVWDGAWGKLNFSLSGDPTNVTGVFNGHGLVAGTDYSLIYYPEVAPWPAPVVVIGKGTADVYGNVHITGTATIGLPDDQPTVGDYIGQTGDKIWLVLSSDINDISKLAGWNPSEYLFEHNLINTPL